MKSEHRAAYRRKITSVIKDHAEGTEHDLAKADVKILEKGVMNQQKSVFLEVWHSVLDKKSFNVDVEFPSCYLPLVKDNFFLILIDCPKYITTHMKKKIRNIYKSGARNLLETIGLFN